MTDYQVDPDTGAIHFPDGFILLPPYDDPRYLEYAGWVQSGNAPGAYVSGKAPLAVRLKTAAIKAERDRRKAGGFYTGSQWFHSDEASRGQYGILLSLAVEKQLPSGYVLNAAWMDMDKVYTPMTVAKLRLIRDVGLVLEAALFDAAKAHIEALQASDDPAAYDFSSGWPAAYGDAA